MTGVENTKREFIPGLELAEGSFHESVAPILKRYMPDVEYSAALIGPGSEVLGFDDSMSTDHHWGPRVMLFLPRAVLEGKGQEIRNLLGEKLPHVFKGYSTNWTEPDPDDRGTQDLELLHDGPVDHKIEMFTLRGVFLPMC